MSGNCENPEESGLFISVLNNSKAGETDGKRPKSNRIFVSYIHIHSVSLQTIDKSILVERLKPLFANNIGPLSEAFLTPCKSSAQDRSRTDTSLRTADFEND